MILDLWEPLEKDFRGFPCSGSFLAKARAGQGWGPLAPLTFLTFFNFFKFSLGFLTFPKKVLHFLRKSLDFLREWAGELSWQADPPPPFP